MKDNKEFIEGATQQIMGMRPPSKERRAQMMRRDDMAFLLARLENCARMVEMYIHKDYAYTIREAAALLRDGITEIMIDDADRERCAAHAALRDFVAYFDDDNAHLLRDLLKKHAAAIAASKVNP